MEGGTPGSTDPCLNQHAWKLGSTAGFASPVMVDRFWTGGKNQRTISAVVSGARTCRIIGCFVRGTISLSTKERSSKATSSSNTTSGRFCLPVVPECHSSFRNLHSQMGIKNKAALCLVRSLWRSQNKTAAPTALILLNAR